MQVTHFSRFEREHVLREMKERLDRATEQSRKQKRVLRASDDPVDFERIARIDRAQQSIARRTKVIAGLDADLKQASASLRSAFDRLSAFRSEVSMRADAMQVGDAQAGANKIRDLMRGLVDAFNTRRADGSYVFGGSGAPVRDAAGPGAGAANFVLSRAVQPSSAVEIGEGVYQNNPPRVWQGVPDLLNQLASAASDLTSATPADPMTVLRSLVGPLDAQIQQISEVQFANDHGARRLDAVRREHALKGEVLAKTRLALEGQDAAEATTAWNDLLIAVSNARRAHIQVVQLSFFDVV
jgi:flagellar hook-associated protein 3 FlgL